MKYVLIVLLFLVGCSKSTDEIQMKLIEGNIKNIIGLVDIMRIQSKTIFLINEQVRRMDKEIREIKENISLRR